MKVHVYSLFKSFFFFSSANIDKENYMHTELNYLKIYSICFQLNMDKILRTNRSNNKGDTLK